MRFQRALKGSGVYQVPGTVLNTMPNANCACSTAFSTVGPTKCAACFVDNRKRLLWEEDLRTEVVGLVRFVSPRKLAKTTDLVANADLRTTQAFSTDKSLLELSNTGLHLYIHFTFNQDNGGKLPCSFEIILSSNCDPIGRRDRCRLS